MRVGLYGGPGRGDLEHVTPVTAALAHLLSLGLSHHTRDVARHLGYGGSRDYYWGVT